MNQQQLRNLRKNAKSWKEHHPDIHAIYLVETDKNNYNKYQHYDCLLIVIVTERFQYEEQRKWAGNVSWQGPEDGIWQFVRKYMTNCPQEWLGDGFSYTHVQEDMARLGFKHFQLLTFHDMESAETYYDEMILPEFHPDTEIEWHNLTDFP